MYLTHLDAVGKDDTHLWAYKQLPGRADNLICAVLVLETAVVVKSVMHLSDKPITREVSQDWNTHISYAEDGSMVEIVVIDAAATSAFPLKDLPALGLQTVQPSAKVYPWTCNLAAFRLWQQVQMQWRVG